jgi:phosphohistidine phosphatase SixA
MGSPVQRAAAAHSLNLAFGPTCAFFFRARWRKPCRAVNPGGPMFRTLSLLLFCPFLLFHPGGALANDWEALKEPGTIAIMRHALAPGTGDPAGFRLEDCASQRLLDARGRAQARQIGAALREAGLQFDKVLTSQWCRTRETAALLDVGPVEDAPALNSFFQDFSTKSDQTQALRDLLAKTEGKLLLVTHQVNISALTGVGTRSGEVLVLRLVGQDAQVVGRLLIEP